MSTEVRNLEPKELWGCFADINQIPRGSKKEEKISKFIKEFGEKLGLETIQDEALNVIIRKPATPGYENRTPIVLQAHMDMVWQANNDTKFDFEKQGIEMLVEDGWVRANGTTLGADNGIGVASILAILKSKTIKHPAIEALITSDEEEGMGGTNALKPGVLKGDLMLNLDTENDWELVIGCAGGVDITISRDYKQEATPQAMKAYKITVNGLNGGHSGLEIHKGLGNANKIMNRVLYKAGENFGLRISSLQGGGKRNAIPRESVAVVVVKQEKSAEFEKHIKEMEKDIKFEIKEKDPDLKISFENTTMPEKVMEKEAQEMLLKSIHCAYSGIFSMSRSVDHLVETSNNMANVSIENGKFKVLCLCRSFMESAKMDAAESVAAAFELSGCKIEFSASYPGWVPDTSSKLLKTCEELHEKFYGKKAEVVACHAGLECGVLIKKYPKMEMISFGPNITGAHSPEEKTEIKSVQVYWDFLLHVLENIPVKK